jgi:HlyD family secretion protein
VRAKSVKALISEGVCRALRDDESMTATAWITSDRELCQISSDGINSLIAAERPIARGESPNAVRERRESTMTTPRLQYSDLDLPEAEPRVPRRSNVRWVLGAVLVLVVLAIAFRWPRTAFAWLGLGVQAAGPAASMPAGQGERLTFTVQPIDLRVTALESGTLESASSLPVLSSVEGQVAIISLVPEGTVVKAGDVVVELESSSMRTRLNEQKIVVEKAKSTFSAAQQRNVVAESQAASDIQTAQLGLEFARLDLKKYLEGDYPLEQRALATEKALAEEELERARVALRFSEELHRDGFINEGEVQADRFKETQSRYKVEIVLEKERVLKEFSYPRVKRELDSKVEEAQRALERARSLAAANVDQAKKALSAEEQSLRLEEMKLAHLEDQIEKCTMRAPHAGIVVYPVPEDQDLVELFIKRGTVIRERQHVYSIPETDELQVSTSIHEALVNRIKPGMQARIWVEVYPDMELKGRVASVSPLPDPEDWRRTTVKFYETKVSLVGKTEGLRPGMSTRVEILIDQQLGVLAVPLQAVVQRGDTGYCYVMDGSTPVLRRVRTGKSNVKHIAILEGLAAGEQVLLTPDLLGVPDEPTKDDGGAGWDPNVVTDAPAAVEPVVQTEYACTLRGAGTTMVEAEFELHTQADVLVKKKFQVTVMNGTPGSELRVLVDGKDVAGITLDAAGNGELDWSTKKAPFPASFPENAGPGSTVRVGDLEGVLNLK